MALKKKVKKIDKNQAKKTKHNKEVDMKDKGGVELNLYDEQEDFEINISGDSKKALITCVDDDSSDNRNKIKNNRDFKTLNITEDFIDKSSFNSEFGSDSFCDNDCSDMIGNEQEKESVILETKGIYQEELIENKEKMLNEKIKINEPKKYLELEKIYKNFERKYTRIRNQNFTFTKKEFRFENYIEKNFDSLYDEKQNLEKNLEIFAKEWYKLSSEEKNKY